MRASAATTHSPLAEAAARQICVLKPSALGDIVQTLPLLPALRSRYPQARISWVVKCELADLLTGHPDIDEIIPFEARGGLSRWLHFLAGLRRRRFDLVLDLQGLLRTALMTWATGAPLRVGLETAREGSRYACNYVIPGTGRLVAAHARYGRVAEAFGVEPTPRATVVWTGEDDRQWARRHVASLGGLTVAMHAGAAWPTKQWPVEKFAAIAGRAMGQYGAAVILIGGKSEGRSACELETTLRRTRKSGRLLNLVGQSNLKQLAALLAEVDLLVSNDSGPLHLAAGLGTPVLGIYTCTSPQRSGPPGDEHELVATQVDCAGSYRKRCPQRGPRRLCCLRELDTARVWRACERLVEKNRLVVAAARPHCLAGNAVVGGDLGGNQRI